MHPYITEFLVEEHQRDLRAEAERERLAYRAAPRRAVPRRRRWLPRFSHVDGGHPLSG
jgi:hypothetical protein